MNPNAPQLTEPYRQSMTFLSFIRGPNSNDWVAEQAEWLVDQIAGGVLPTEENLWQVVITQFTNTYTDPAIKTWSQRQLRELQMKQETSTTILLSFKTSQTKQDTPLMKKQPSMSFRMDSLIPSLSISLNSITPSHGTSGPLPLASNTRNIYSSKIGPTTEGRNTSEGLKDNGKMLSITQKI